MRIYGETRDSGPGTRSFLAVARMETRTPIRGLPVLAEPIGFRISGSRVPGPGSRLLFIPEPLQRRFVIRPACPHLHPRLQKNAAAEKFLDTAAGGAADLLQAV